MRTIHQAELTTYQGDTTCHLARFDKLKLISNIDNVSNISPTAFVTTTRSNGEIIYLKHQTRSPFLLDIRIDYQHRELTLEFTGKMQLDRYPELINKHTIRYCLEQINRMGICTLDVEAVMRDALVAKCDVTIDVQAERLEDIVTTIRQNIKNYKKWNVSEYQAAEGVVLNNVCKTPKYKKRLSVYDKAKELTKSENKAFLDKLANKAALIEYFNDKVRFEVNINTMCQIREMFEITDNRLQTVLDATANPILKVIDEALRATLTPIRKMSLRNYERWLLIHTCNYNLREVEAVVRGLVSKNTSITRQMQPYRELTAQASTCKTVNIRELVA